MRQSSTPGRGRKPGRSTAPGRNKAADKNPGSRTQSSSRSDQKRNSLSASSARGNKAEHNGRNAQGSAKGGPYLQKFFVDQLKDIYYAEQKLTQALATMKDAATTEELQEAFEDHMHLTERHARRLEKVFISMGMKPEGKRCDAIEGIIREVETIIGETEEGTMTRDAALILGGQKVEHYEIATYGGLVTLAITMGFYEEADLLDRTLIEEVQTDLLLTDIAENYINLEAEHEGYEEEEDQEGMESAQEAGLQGGESEETGNTD
jgi:ferritin-like metal-binding protein YciE